MSTSDRTTIPAPGEQTQAQKLMVFVLSMSLFGLANIFTEILPEIQAGPFELSISYLAFVPLTMVFLFNPLYAAIGAPLGEIVFKDLLLGDFSGVGEVEGFIQMALSLFIAGLIVRDPLNRRQLVIASIVFIVLEKGMSGIVDMGKVLFGIEDLETVEGLPESVLAIEGVAFVTEFAISGILFGLIPVLWLVPRLYGKIEPLMGMQPRDPNRAVPLAERATPGFVGLAVFFAIAALVIEFLAAADENFGEIGLFEPDFVDQYGQRFMWLGVLASVLALIAIILVARAVARARRGGAADEIGGAGGASGPTRGGADVSRDSRDDA